MYSLGEEVKLHVLSETGCMEAQLYLNNILRKLFHVFLIYGTDLKCNLPDLGFLVVFLLHYLFNAAYCVRRLTCRTFAVWCILLGNNINI